MNTTKKTAFGITAAAGAALLTVGFASPAMAADGDYTETHDSSTTTSHLLSGNAFQEIFGLGDVTNSSPIFLAPEISTGDIASSNPIASGNDVQAPIASGNETAVGSGNETNVTDNAVGNVTNDVSDVVDNATDVTTGVSDVVDSTTGVTSDVSDIVSDVTNSVDVGGIVTDVTDAVDLDSILGR